MSYFSLWPGTAARWHPSCALPQMPGESRARTSPTACIIDSQSVKSLPKNGGLHRSARLRCGQADHGHRSAMFWSTPKACCCTASSPPHVQDREAACHAAGELIRKYARQSVPLLEKTQFADSAAGHDRIMPVPGRHPAPSRDRDRQAIRSPPALSCCRNRWIVDRSLGSAPRRTGWPKFLVPLNRNAFSSFSGSYLRRPGLRKVLEKGCGTGYVLSGLESENRYELFGAELHIDGLVLAKRRLPGIEFVQLNARDLPYVNEFDAIGAFDVLEHIEEDHEVIRSVYQALAPDGLFIVTVPQHRWLWSAADVHARHKRRYSRKELISKLEQRGFTIEYCSSFVFFLLPVMYISRIVRGGRPNDGVGRNDATYEELALPKPINAIMQAIMAIDELFIAAGISLPVGGSLLIVARRTVV